jgi:hypothetical protein
MSKPVRKFSRLNTNMFLHLECSNVYRLRPMSLAGTPENPGSGISLKIVVMCNSVKGEVVMLKPSLTQTMLGAVG